jgi:hypothetical protein
MTISKATFAPSTPFTIHFECMESAPNDSTWVRRLTVILRRARVEIFIVAYGSFWLKLSGFLSNLTGHHETKIAKPIWSCRSKYSNFYIKPRLPMTKEGALDRFCTFRVLQTPANLVILVQVRTSPHFQERTFIKRRKRASSQFSAAFGGIFPLLFVSITKTRVLYVRALLTHIYSANFLFSSLVAILPGTGYE